MNNHMIERVKKELYTVKCILVPSFMQSKIKKISKSILIILLLSIILIFSSAFISRPKENKFISRFKFAQVLAKLTILTDAQEAGRKCFFDFPDLSALQQTEIASILNLGIMSAYPDGKFHPNKLLRNFEVIHFLKLALKNSKLFSDNLKTVFPINYNASQMDISSYYKCKLLQGRDKLSDVAKNSFIKPLFASKKSGVITGQIVDAISEEYISNTHLIVNGKAILVNDEGCFQIDKTNLRLENSLSFFVSSEGYRSLSFKQSSFYSRIVKIRLKPETSFVTLKAFSSLENRKLTSFSVSIKNRSYDANEFGEVQINHLKHGSYNAIFSAKGFSPVRKNLLISSDNTTIQAKLSSI